MALGVVLMETIYSEFSAPNAGFTAAFLAGGLCCLAAAGLLEWFVKEAGPKENGNTETKPSEPGGGG